MSLTVKHLNGDTTFLLTFSPSEKQPLPSPSPQYCQPPGKFTILIDPWLSGATTMWHPKFLLSRHTVQSCIQHLSHIPEPNIVLISQDKPDHCHESTLRQLDPTSPVTNILAEPAAAKRIRGMKHFHPSMVHSLRPFSEKKPDSVLRFFIPPIVPGGAPGEATISFIQAKMDVSGVHNAIGITYRPPSTSSLATRPFSPTSQSSQPPFPLSSYRPPANLPATPPGTPDSSAVSSSTPPTSITSSPSHNFSSTHNSISTTSSLASMPNAPRREKALSLIYSPHGISYPLLVPYASCHLVPTAALPLTLLLHSLDRVSNPWWMGGNVATGLPGGVEIAKALMTRCWISAHDEEKDNSGVSVMNVKTKKYTKEEVGKIMREQGCGGVTVMNLGVGEELVLKA